MSASLNGTNAYINIPDADNLSFGNGSTDSPFSIFMRVHMGSANTTRLYNKWVNTGTTGYEIFITTGGDSKLYFRCYDDSTVGYIGRVSTATLTGYVNTWIDLVFTYDGGGSNTGMKIYLNGSVLSTTGATGGSYTAMENTGSSVDIGRIRSTTTTYGDFEIDDYRVYSRELSANDVLELYSGKRHTEINGLVMWAYDLDLDYKDKSGNGNNGTGTNVTVSALNPQTRY